MKNYIVTFEGIDCSGKGEQSKRLLAYFKKLNQPAILTREPGGTPYGEALRAMIKHPEIAIGSIIKAFAGHEDFPKDIDISEGFYRSDYCELLMFLAARAEFVAKSIKPSLARGEIDIIDRFYDSTRAYQGGGRFLGNPTVVAMINKLNKFVLQGLKPAITFFLDITVDEMIARRNRAAQKDAYFEKTCDRNFFDRARCEYFKIAKEEPDRFVIIDGNRDIEEIHLEIIKKIATISGED
ncbi:MAG: dTMP kinase [Candidatus Buchananbacteria bacterium]|nr:dTMP kinase [Candidatus Buchananbacteria bacterium]